MFSRRKEIKRTGGRGKKMKENFTGQFSAAQESQVEEEKKPSKKNNLRVTLALFLHPRW